MISGPKNQKKFISEGNSKISRKVQGNKSNSVGCSVAPPQLRTSYTWKNTNNYQMMLRILTVRYSEYDDRNTL